MHGSMVMSTQHDHVCGTSVRPTVVRKRSLPISHATTVGPLTMCCGCRRMLVPTFWRCHKFTHRADHSHANGLCSQHVPLKWECRCALQPSPCKQLRVRKLLADVQLQESQHGMAGVSCVATSMRNPPQRVSRWARRWIFVGDGQMVS